jgi:hypothetical protein
MLELIPRPKIKLILRSFLNNKIRIQRTSIVAKTRSNSVRGTIKKAHSLISKSECAQRSDVTTQAAEATYSASYFADTE